MTYKVVISFYINMQSHAHTRHYVAHMHIYCRTNRQSVFNIYSIFKKNKSTRGFTCQPELFLLKLFPTEMGKENRSICKRQVHNFIGNDQRRSHICMHSFSKKKMGGEDIRKLISHCICKAFWDTRTPGGGCMCTINNFSEFVLGFL